MNIDVSLFYFGSASSSAATISANVSSIPMLNGTNFKDWKRYLEIVLGCMDIDLALRVEQPASLTAESTPDERKDFERWDRSNRMSLMIMKHSIPETFRGTESEKITLAKDFLDNIEQRFAKNDKVEMTSLLTSLMSMKYKGQGNIREYIMEMFHTASKLKALKIELSEDLLVLMVLLSLPPQFSQFKISYNCQKEKWTLNELISHCVQEEERLKREKSESAHLASTSKDKGKKRKYQNEAAKGPAAKGPAQKKQEQAPAVCFFCDKTGHMKKDCTKYHAWRAKKGLLHETKRFLSKHFEMKDLGDASFVLGIEIHRDRSRGILGLSQKNYIDKVLKRFSMQNSKLMDTPVAKGDKFCLAQCPKSDLEIQEMKKVPYTSAIGSLMYAQVCTRPDIAYIVGVLGRYSSNPGMDHWIAAKRVMRYLRRTKDYMLTYRKSDHLEVVGYSDSDFAGCQDSRKSTSGYIYLLAGGAISWKSAKQTLVASSTMAAEFVACYEASNHGIWLRNFVTGLRILKNVERPLKLFCDNKSAVLYSNNNRSSSKSKHIDIKFLAVKERVQSGQISIEHIGTNSMIADPLTKGLPPKVFHEHTAHMGVTLFEDIIV
ncbi:hypothetical protein GQ457_16G021540 [Hibiscus cannabinus]